MFKVTTLLTEVNGPRPIDNQKKESFQLILKVFSFVFLFFISSYSSGQQSNLSGDLANKQIIQSQTPSSNNSPLNGVQVVQPNTRLQFPMQTKVSPSPVLGVPTSQQMQRQISVEVEAKEKQTNIAKPQGAVEMNSVQRVSPTIVIPDPPSPEEIEVVRGRRSNNNQN